MKEDFSPPPKTGTKPYGIESALNDLLKLTEVAFHWKEARTEGREMAAFPLKRRRFISKTLTLQRTELSRFRVSYTSFQSLQVMLL